jgi:hypothetical protein
MEVLMSDSVALHNESEVDDNLETPAKIKLCDTLLPLNISAFAIILSVIAVLHVEKVKTAPAMSLLTFLTLLLLIFGASNLVWRLLHKFRVSDLRGELQLNDELRSREKIGFEEWKQTYDARSPKEWPLIWKIGVAADSGIYGSFLGLALFAVWVMCETARLS